MSDLADNSESQAQFVNIAAYKFVALDHLQQRRAELLSLCRTLQLKGTILLSVEGINMFLAGTRPHINEFLQQLTAQPQFSNLEVKESLSDHQPFRRMLVRLKKEIISMGVPEVRPQLQTSPKISPRQLKAWLDEGKELTLLDTRNDYEHEIGSFENSVLLPIDHFRQFPEMIDNLPADLREKPLVMFCTGGIRCEKAGPLMESRGFQHVYQLDGGILKYFEDCGGEHYRGACFVFDKRVALDPQLNETGLALCFHCQAILSREEQQHPHYQPPRTCPRCHPLSLSLEERLASRARKLREATTPLPGSVPYLNQRPMSVTAGFDERPLLEFLMSLHVELTREYWLESCAQGRVRYRNQPLQPDHQVRAGWRLYHLVPETVEPDVSNAVDFLFEDENLIAINKPAPLPMHACGRFNKNSLQNFIRLSYPHETIRILHRLDAETTGVLILGRDRLTSTRLHQQFASGQVRKTYLARVWGHPDVNQFECRRQITGKPSGPAGIRHAIDEPRSHEPLKERQSTKPAVTQFEVVQRLENGTTLIKCMPLTGRTNQIRVHLASLGYPIVGDSGYGQHSWSEFSGQQTDPQHDLGCAAALNSELHQSETRMANGRSAHSGMLNLHALALEFDYPARVKMRLQANPPAWAGGIEL
jgi:RluA family pseudouridine synthase